MNYAFLKTGPEAIGFRHGHSLNGKKSATYRAWLGMRSRCFYKNRECYPYYGGRGIKVCERWANSFENFLTDMGERPEGKTLDRYPDQNGNYEPSNCRWATREEQSNNRRSNRWVTCDGITDTIPGWAKRLGISASTLRHRMLKGQDLTSPVKRRKSGEQLIHSWD